MPLKSYVLGCNGYFGRHLAHELERTGFENHNFDIHPEPSSGISNYRPFDVTRKEHYGELDPEVDFIFLFAGRTGTDQGFKDYEGFVDVNEIGPLHVLEWMHQTDCRARIVFPSSRLVYKGNESRPLREGDPKEARTVYAINKLATERILWAYQNAFGINYTVFRICVPYGDALGAASSYGTLDMFQGMAAAGQDISLFGDGGYKRTFTHVSDLATLIVRTVQSEQTGNDIFNVGGEALSLRAAAEQIAQKYSVGVRFVDWPEMALRLETGSTVFDDSKLARIVPCEFQRSLASWLKEI